MATTHGRRGRRSWFPGRVIGVLAVLAALVALPVAYPAADPTLDAPVSSLSLATHAAPARSPSLPGAPHQPATATSARWLWPLHPDPPVRRRFSGPAQPWLPGHRGVDLAATLDQEVRAPASGRVAFAGVVVDRGVLTIEHGDGLRTTYEPVVPLLQPGAHVEAGHTVALVSAAKGHCAPGTCLHWGLRRGSAYLDPLAMLGPPEPPVLLPLRRTRDTPQRSSWL